MQGGEDGVIDPFRVPVPGELVPVEVGDHKLGGMEVPEGMGGITLVGLDQQHVGLDPPAQGGVGQHQGNHALNLVGALFVVDHGPSVRPEDGGDHLHRGGLPVGPGNGDDMPRQLYAPENVRADFQGKLSRHGASLADELAHKPP